MLSSRSPLLWVIGIAFAAHAHAATVTSATTLFETVPFPGVFDPSNDHQTGHTDADLIGNAANPGFYALYDSVANNVYYRVRLGAVFNNEAGLAERRGVLWIAIDANADGALDLFLSVNNQGSNRTIEFRAPGPSANTSPNTTSIGASQPQYVIQQNINNTSYQPVSTALQPGITSFDVNGDGQADAFLTVAIPFAGAAGTATLQGALMALAGISITENSTLSYVVATSTQTNSLNQDIGGIDDRVMNVNLSWTKLGAITPLLDLGGAQHLNDAPESSTLPLVAGGCLLLIASRRRAA